MRILLNQIGTGLIPHVLDFTLLKRNGNGSYNSAFTAWKSFKVGESGSIPGDVNRFLQLKLYLADDQSPLQALQLMHNEVMCS